ncbi:MAG: dephospho-CoA kinase [Oligoflexales bacterium]
MPIDKKILSSICRCYGIGLTGGVATGKSTIARLLGSQHIVIDADQLAREVVQPGAVALLEIAALFGDEILHKDGSLNRRSLRKKIQESPQDKDRLEEVMHPAIQEQLFYKLYSKGLFDNPQPWFYEAALLIEKNKISDFRDLWLTDCPKSTQIIRLMGRDHISYNEAEALIHTQASQEEKKYHAQIIINTDKPISELKTTVDQLVRKRFFTLGLHSVNQG